LGARPARRSICPIAALRARIVTFAVERLSGDNPGVFARALKLLKQKGFISDDYTGQKLQRVSRSCEASA
jgi:hypothetical protein